MQILFLHHIFGGMVKTILGISYLFMVENTLLPAAQCENTTA